MNITIMFIICFNTIYLIFLLKEKIIKPLIIIKKNNKVQKIDYYREQLDEYSPLMYAKLLGKNIYNSDVITATILYLKNKGFDEKNAKIDNINFMRHEKFFIQEYKFILTDLKNHTNSKYNSQSTIKGYLEDLIEEDLKEEGLLKKDYRQNITTNGIELNINLIDFISILFIFGNLFFAFRLLNNIDVTSNTFYLFKNIELIINLTWTTIYLINMNFKLFFKSKLEDKGKEYIQKLKASKRYLKEYSTISHKKIEDEIIWESYIKNAIFFNLKGKLDKDSRQYYRNIITSYGYKNKTKYDDIIVFILGFWPIYIILFPGIISGDSMARIILYNFIVNPLLIILFLNNRNSKK